MAMKTRKELLFNYLFITSLVLLALNDHLWKGMYHNWFTGKISDFAGLVVLPLFLAFLFPRLARRACHISALFFIYWKTELSSGLIEFLNTNGFFTFGRTIDYSDFIALLILPLPWRQISKKPISINVNRLGLTSVVLSTLFLLVATTLPPTRTVTPEGTIVIDQKHRLRVPKDTVLARIEQLGYSYEVEDGLYTIRDIIVPEIVNPHKYRIEQDTIKELIFYFADYTYQPTKRQAKLGAQYLYIHQVKFSEVNTITDWRLMKKYSKLYHRVTKGLFAKESTKK